MRYAKLALAFAVLLLVGYCADQFNIAIGKAKRMYREPMPEIEWRPKELTGVCPRPKIGELPEYLDCKDKVKRMRSDI